jgi:uncharacterized protein
MHPFAKHICIVLSKLSRQAACIVHCLVIAISIYPLTSHAWDKDSLAQLQPLAEKGNAEAQYFVGMLYQLGIGGADRDLKQALLWFQKSAAANDPLGAYKLGCFYAGQFPDVIAIDNENALRYKRIAADAGYSLAQSDVGTMYFQRGDFSESEKWWRLAAAQANPSAANNLSVLYHEGKHEGKLGTPDFINAYAWFKIAYTVSRRKMDDKAEEHLSKIAKEMTPADIAKAEKQATRWRVKPNTITVNALYPKPRVEALLTATTP